MTTSAVGRGAALAVGAGIVALSCTPRWPGLDTSDDGRTSYLRACAPCHGEDGRGDGPVAPALTVSPADLTTLAARHGGDFPREYVIAVIAGERQMPAHGTQEMPVWSQRFGTGSGASAAASLYARRRLEQLADYVASLQRAGGPSR